jgi:hypothetical protein
MLTGQKIAAARLAVAAGLPVPGAAGTGRLRRAVCRRTSAHCGGLNIPAEEPAVYC